MHANRAFTGLLLMAALTSVTVLPPVVAQAAEPVGWTPVFASDFSGDALPPQCRAYDGPYGGAAASYYRPDEAAVSGGFLRLGIHRRDFGNKPYTTGGMACFSLAQRYGRYEYRAKAPLGAGIDSYMALWPENNAAGDAALIDVLAKPGAERAVLSNRYGAGTTSKTVDGPFSDGFHTFIVEWAPSGFRVLIDGKQQLSDGRASTTRRWFGFAVSSGDSLSGLPDAATTLPAEFLVDFVRVWSYDPGAGKPGGASGASASGGAGGTGAAGIGADGTGPDVTLASPPSAAGAGQDARTGGVGRSATSSIGWRLRRLSTVSPSWLAAGLAIAAFLGAILLIVHRRRPRRPPSAHRA
jgi:hypothetical protein